MPACYARHSTRPRGGTTTKTRTLIARHTRRALVRRRGSFRQGLELRHLEGLVLLLLLLLESEVAHFMPPSRLYKRVVSAYGTHDVHEHNGGVNQSALRARIFRDRRRAVGTIPACVQCNTLCHTIIYYTILYYTVLYYTIL